MNQVSHDAATRARAADPALLEQSWDALVASGALVEPSRERRPEHHAYMDAAASQEAHDTPGQLASVSSPGHTYG